VKNLYKHHTEDLHFDSDFDSEESFDAVTLSMSTPYGNPLK